MILLLYLTIFCLCFARSIQFEALIPSLGPLHFITPQVVGEYLVENGEAALWSALLPVDQQDAVAIFISEGVSGFLGGVAAKGRSISSRIVVLSLLIVFLVHYIGISLIDGNRNDRQTSLGSAETSGAYFGTAAAIRSLAQLAGLSNVLVNILSLTFAAALSEFVKIRSMTINPQRTRVGEGPTMYDLMKFKNPSMQDMVHYISAMVHYS
jgi:hypothetical protein